MFHGLFYGCVQEWWWFTGCGPWASWCCINLACRCRPGFFKPPSSSFCFSSACLPSESVYACDSKSIAGVPFRRYSADHPITAHHSYVSLTSWQRGLKVYGITNQYQNQLCFQPQPVAPPPPRHLGSLTSAILVSFNLIIFWSLC